MRPGIRFGGLLALHHVNRLVLPDSGHTALLGVSTPLLNPLLRLCFATSNTYCHAAQHLGGHLALHNANRLVLPGSRHIALLEVGIPICLLFNFCLHVAKHQP